MVEACRLGISRSDRTSLESPTMEPTYTMDEVSEHNHDKDLWVVIHDGVYDLTKFLTEHPGGEEALLQCAGSDGTVCFDDIGHTIEAIHLRETHRIGRISRGSKSAGSRPAGAPGSGSQDDNDWTYEEPKNETSPWLPVVVGIGAIVYGIIFYRYFLL